MSSRHPVVLTSLEEDFKKLGLLSEDDQMKAAPKGEPASNKASGSRNVGSMSDDPSNTGEDDHDEPNGIPHQGKPKSKTNPAGPEPKPMKAESIKGMPDKRRAVEAEEGESDPDEDDDDEKKAKNKDDDDDKEESFTPRGASAVSEAINRMRTNRSQTESRSAVARAESLIESVTALMDQIDESHREESVKAFANVSIIAEMLSRGFNGFAEKYNDAELAEAAEALTVLSGEASEIAQVLESDDEVNTEVVESEFRKEMDALVSGLDLYSDLVDADEHLSEEEESEESDDSEAEAEAIAEAEDDDDDDDKDDDDDDDDDDDKKSKKAPPFGKKEEGAGPRFKSALVKKGGKPMAPSTGARSALTMSKSEAYMPYGTGKGPMVSKPGKAKSGAAKESKK